MQYVINDFTQEDCFFHSSKKGLIGEILPYCNDASKKRDFGDGFYLGNKPKQTIALVNSNPEAKLYKIKIPYEKFNESNTLQLSQKDWMYFVLLNRGYLSPIKGTAFYRHYEHLADGKNFIMGAIADDVFSTCIKDFSTGVITDYAFLNLINCYSYGTQIVAKTEEACRSLEIVSEIPLTTEDRKEALNSRRFTRAEQDADYIRRRTSIMMERKGQFIEEIFEDIRQGKLIPDSAFKSPKAQHKYLIASNLQFESLPKEENTLDSSITMPDSEYFL